MQGKFFVGGIACVGDAQFGFEVLFGELQDASQHFAWSNGHSQLLVTQLRDGHDYPVVA